MSKAHLPQYPLYTATENVWRENHCLKETSISLYRLWVCRFITYCQNKQLDEYAQLTLIGVSKFAFWYARNHDINRNNAICIARSALKTWSNALQILGRPVPLCSQVISNTSHTPIIKAFSNYLHDNCGNASSTIHKKIHHINSFKVFLNQQEDKLLNIKLQDIDEFISICSKRYSQSTTSDICSSLRSFTRYLLISERISVDLAPSILSPKFTKFERPHKVLPWDDVCNILQAINRETPCGMRDYALLLMMSVYGFGAGEVIGLTLDDIDWKASTIHVTRPKTKVEFQLPLLPAVGEAVANYLRFGRPCHTLSRHLFVIMRSPHTKLACAVTIRHILHTHAKRAGVTADFLGTHVLRHTHACRQIDLGTPVPIIGDILGHSDPASTSAYIRVSINHLREISLQVPSCQ